MNAAPFGYDVGNCCMMDHMMDQRGLAYHFASWVQGLAPDTIAPSVHAAAQRAMIDTLGVTIAGSAHADIVKLASIWGAQEGPARLCVGGTASSETAALVNGSAAHVWDFDDTSYTGIMHGSAVVFPVVIALAQELGKSEDAARTAFIAGSEITYVLADICTHAHYFDGWWSTVTFGLVGATAAAAKLFDCTETQTAQAIGLAAAAAGGGKSLFGTGAKPFLVGEAAQRAVGFARYAASGLSGPTGSFEGTTGFFHLLNKDRQQPDQVESLGQRWRLIEPGLLFKRNPVCSAAHAAIEEAARLTFHAGVSVDEIDQIDVEIPQLVRMSLVHDSPQTPGEAQFSLPFAIACAVQNGAVRLADLSADSLHDATLQTLMNKVRIRVVDDLSTDEMRKKYPESARIRITRKDQTIRQGFCGEAYGMPNRPLSDTDFLAKFHDCLAYANRSLDTSGILQQDILDLIAGLYKCAGPGVAVPENQAKKDSHR